MTRWRRDGQCTRRCRLSWTPRSRAPASTRRWPTFRRRLRLIVRLLEQDIRAGVAVFVPGYMPARLEAEDQRLAQRTRGARNGAGRTRRATRDATPRATTSRWKWSCPGRGRRPGDPAGQAEWPACAASAARGRRGLAQRPHAAGAVRLPAACDARRKPHRPAVGAGRPGGAADADLVAVHPDGHALHPGDGCADLLAAGRDNLDHVPADRVPQQHRVCVRARPAELPGRDAPDVRAGAGAAVRVGVPGGVRDPDRRRPCAGTHHATQELAGIHAVRGADGLLRRRHGPAVRRDRDLLALLPAAGAGDRALPADLLGVFFVSEQLPEHLRPWMLWLPFAHGMQLLRSAYFDAYASQDASLGYF